MDNEFVSEHLSVVYIVVERPKILSVEGDGLDHRMQICLLLFWTNKTNAGITLKL